MQFHIKRGKLDDPTCCEEKKQQTDVELHFQFWDISESDTCLFRNSSRLLFIDHLSLITLSLRFDATNKTLRAQMESGVRADTSQRRPGPSLLHHGVSSSAGASRRSLTHIRNTCAVLMSLRHTASGRRRRMKRRTPLVSAGATFYTLLLRKPASEEAFY